MSAARFQILRWMPESDAVEGQSYLVSGGVAVKRAGKWFTLTGCDAPGRPIQWEVKYCAPLAYEPEDDEIEKERERAARIVCRVAVYDHDYQAENRQIVNTVDERWHAYLPEADAILEGR